MINKQQGSTPVTLSLANFTGAATAQDWQINSASQTSVARLADVAVANNAISTTVPSQSITLFVVPAGAIAKPPAAPTGLGATAGNGQIVLAWTASSGATSYSVYRGTVAGAESGTPIVTGLTTATYTNTGLTNGTRYFYKVAAVNTGGTSPLSNEAAATPIASACDVNQDASTNVSDVQSMMNQARGTGPAVNDLNHDGVVNAVDIQIVIDAAMGMACAGS